MVAHVYGRRLLRFGAGADTVGAIPPPPQAVVAGDSPAPGTGAPDRPVTSPQAVMMMLLNELIPGLLASMVVGGLVWNSTHAIPIPQQLSDLCIAIAAFYFGVRGRGPVQVQLTH